MLCCSNPTLLSRIAAASGQDLEPVRLERLSTDCGDAGLGLRLLPEQPQRLHQPLRQRPLAAAAAAAPLAGPASGYGHGTGMALSLMAPGCSGGSGGMRAQAGGMEAYDLARRLVSSAGASGSVGSAGPGYASGSGGGGAYTSAARKVRVSVKIPDREIEDLPPGWEGDLRLNGQREAALVLFTYMRRGCVQLVMDVFAVSSGGGSGGGSEETAQAAAVDRGQLAVLPLAAAAGQGAEGTTDGGAEAAISLGHTGGASVSGISGGGGHLHRQQQQQQQQQQHLLQKQKLPDCSKKEAPRAVINVTSSSRFGFMPPPDHGHGHGSNHCNAPKLCDAAPNAINGSGGRGAVQVAYEWRASPAPPADEPISAIMTVQQLLRVVGSDSRLLAGRTVTVQVGANVSRAHVGADGVAIRTVATSGSDHDQERSWVAAAAAAAADGADASHPTPVAAAAAVAAAPVAPPDVRVWPQVVCSGGGSGRRAGLLAVQLSCSWEAESGWRHVEDVLAVPSAVPGQASHQSESELQLTARQQGRFLHVTAAETGAAAGRPQWEGNEVAAAVAIGAATSGRCRLVLSPVRREGLVQVELSRGGVQSVVPAAVLLVSSTAVAHELQQLLLPQAADAATGDAAVAGPAAVVAQLPEAAAQGVLRDFGVFLDIAAELSGGDCDGDGISLQAPLISWVLPPAGAADTAPAPQCVVLFEGAGSDSSAASASASTTAGCCERRLHLNNVAGLGSRVGLGLLRYFLAAGLPACAVHVLDALHEQMGMPPSLLAAYCCPGGFTLLHHAARSGALGPMATLASWLEARGAAPGWVDGGEGLSPLHLLAVAPGGAVAAAAAAALQLRWPAARVAWRRAGTQASGCGASPAAFAAIAAAGGRGLDSAAALSRVADVAAALGVGIAWRCGVHAVRAAVPRRAARAGWELLAQSQRFAAPSLETSYEAWMTRRTAAADHLFLGLYAAYAASQVSRMGWAPWVAQNQAGLLLLVMRLTLLALSFTRACQYSPETSSSSIGSPLPMPNQTGNIGDGGLVAAQRQGGRGAGDGGAAGAGAAGAASAPGGGAPWLLRCREGRAVLLEVARCCIMWLSALGVVGLPYTWRRMVTLKLDVLFNTSMRPLAYQMRVGSSVVCAAAAVAGETVVMAVVLWGRPTPLALTWALVRSAVAHGLGLGCTVLLQVSARRRFLAERRERVLASAAMAAAPGAAGGKAAAAW